MSYKASESKHGIPKWWEKTKAIYCPVSGGAGASLMSFALDFNAGSRSKEQLNRLILDSEKPHYDISMGTELIGMRINEKISTFSQLPDLLGEAHLVNSNLIYMADYWEGGYFIKGDYVPRADFGGAKAFKEAVKKIHELGGKIILYLEAFIISRSSKIGMEQGPKWAMMDKDGKYLGYFRNMDHTYYQMWPGKGSGWSRYLADKAEQMIKEFDVDGFHLDSYGMVQEWRDHHPDHADGLEPGEFDRGAVDLMKDFRGRIRSVKEDAIVIMEGSEKEDILAQSDGAQDWSLIHLADQPWYREGTYKVFTSEFGLSSMQQILARGYNVTISGWWTQPLPGSQMTERLLKADISPKGTSWIEQTFTRSPVRDLWWCYNTLWANGLVQPDELDMEWLRVKVPPFPFPGDPYLGSDEGRKKWKLTVEEILRRLRELDFSKAISPAQYLNRIIQKAEKDLLPI